MYFLSSFCCVCLKNENILKLSAKGNDGITHIDKLAMSVVGMDFKEMDDVRFICEGCCTTLNTVYTFQQKCLRSKANLITYVSKLQTFSKVHGTLSVRLKDIKDEIKVEKQHKEIICENETDKHTTSDIFTSVMIKNEYSIEENGYHTSTNNLFKNNKDIIIKNEKMDNMNITEEYNFIDKNLGDGHIKEEEENPDYIEYFEDYKEDPLDDVDNKSGTNIEERPIVKVKEEFMSDTELPQDGSTYHIDGKAAGIYKINENLSDSSRENISCNKNGILMKTFESGTVLEMTDRPFKCDQCTAKFPKQWSLDRHMRTHTGERPFECEVCKKSFAQAKYLTIHMRKHTGEAPYECEICKKKFISKVYLEVHMRIHTGEKPYECHICKKTFAQSGSLSGHMRTHSGAKPFACEICKKKFSYTWTLNVHMRIHTGEKLFECEICNKNFTLKPHLEVHMRQHTGEKPFECEICKKKFAHAGSRTAHMRLHTGERPFSCEICKKTFSQSSSLKIHMLYHSGVKPYECDVCKKTFRVKGNLRTHRIIHSTLKPYECDICKTAFNTKGSRTRHMRIHSAE